MVDLLRRFKALCRKAGIKRSDGSNFHPRIFDLRHTFAVHRITSWIDNGVELNRMLPALATYMGFANLIATEKHLRMTPARFRKQLATLVPVTSSKHWRDDPSLIAFLATL